MTNCISKSVSILSSSSSVIQTFTCPYLGGNAVFRARVLHAMKHFGIHYDDLEICNGQGVYKGGISKLQQQLNTIANYNPNAQVQTKTFNEDAVYIYPNPAYNSISIACANANKIVIYDLLGNTLMNQKLIDSNSVNKLDVSSLQTGIYMYKILMNNNVTFNGKLTIE